MDEVRAILVPGFMSLVTLLAIGFILARLYIRAHKDRAFVRTGLGGQKVVLDGGALVLPVFHSTAWVNLQTLRLDVRRDNADAMISKDRMRVDIGVEFYVRVKPDSASIALAAQTLGDRTNDSGQLRQLVEAKFVDALRSVAATMTLDELQEQRAQFVQAVQTAVARDLELNGLELESASLTKLDQTDTKFFNPNNAFDAEGLATLTKITEARRQERNLVVRSTEVLVSQQDLEARQQTLNIERQKTEAELHLQRDIANKTAETRAATALKEAEARQAEAEAKIAADQAIAVREAQAKQTQETAHIAANLGVRQQQIESERAAESLTIAKQRDIEIAEQERQIAVQTKSQAESIARAEAEKARALAMAASESVITAKEVAIAERERQIEIIRAKQEAEKEATRVTVAAQAERQAAEDQAEANRTLAQADADAARIRAAAAAETNKVEAEGQRMINEARNILSGPVIELEIMRERLRILPLALELGLKPLEKIGDVKIVDMGGGVFGSGRTTVSGEESGGRTVTDQLLQSLMQYRAAAPIIDKLLAEGGFHGDNPVEALLSAVGGKPVTSGSDKPQPAAKPKD